jgi:peptidoglycan/xylan/chitin deacetylase (PgdA/CDA1 family)
MRKVIKKTIVLLLYFSGLSFLIGKFQRNKVFCVGYHSIWDDKNKNEFSQELYKNISVNSRDFEKQILFLKNNGHNFIHFSDLEKIEVKKLNKPTIIFFDDGFKDVYVNALPILKKHNIPATIFITTGLIERTDFLWTLGLRYFLIKKGVNLTRIENKLRELKRLSMVDREMEIGKIFNTDNFILKPVDFNIFLNWEEVVSLSQNQFEIGSHSTKHQKLTELPPPELKIALESSKAILEAKISTRVTTVSYPYGRHNEEVVDSVRSAGYTIGVSTMSGSNSFEYIKNTPFKIKRINPEEDKNFIDFKVRLYTNL